MVDLYISSFQAFVSNCIIFQDTKRLPIYYTAVQHLLYKLGQHAELVGRVKAEVGHHRSSEVFDGPGPWRLVVSGVLHVHVLLRLLVHDDLLLLLLLLLFLLL